MYMPPWVNVQTAMPTIPRTMPATLPQTGKRKTDWLFDEGLGGEPPLPHNHDGTMGVKIETVDVMDMESFESDGRKAGQLGIATSSGGR